jgi:hypothetical protein
MQTICPLPVLFRICYQTVLPISVREPTCLPSGLRSLVTARRLPPQLHYHSYNVRNINMGSFIILNIAHTQNVHTCGLKHGLSHEGSNVD